MFELINNTNLEIKKQVLLIFVGLLKSMPGSFDCINKAVVNVAKRNSASPYGTLL